MPISVLAQLPLMGDKLQPSVFELAKVLSEGFAALSGEYQLLVDQQHQLESKLSYAKQQVCFTLRIHCSHLS